jgi:predicted dehydrogenase
MRKMRLFQRDNYISIDFITGISEVYRLIPVDEKPGSSMISFGEIGIGERKKRVVYEQPEVKEINALKYELELFVNAVLNDKQPKVSGQDGLKALKVANIILNKIEELKIS